MKVFVTTIVVATVLVLMIGDQTIKRDAAQLSEQITKLEQQVSDMEALAEERGKLLNVVSGMADRLVENQARMVDVQILMKKLIEEDKGELRPSEGNHYYYPSTNWVTVTNEFWITNSNEYY